MRHSALALVTALALAAPPALHAQVPVRANPNQAQMLAGPAGSPGVAANKRLVYDFWREVFEGGHMERAEHYLAESYIQHNPNVGTGRAAFVELFGKLTKPKPIQTTIQAPLVAIVGEGDLVVLVFAHEAREPKDANKTYTSTWFDMFRIEDGKIAEHWDPARKR